MSSAQFLLLLLGATWGGMFNVLKVIEMKNGIRNLVLDIDKEGEAVSVKQKRMLLWGDYFPLAIGIWIFLCAFSVIVYSAPEIMKAMHDSGKLDVKLPTLLYLCCYLVVSIGVFAVIVDITSTIVEVCSMRKHLKNSEKRNEDFWV